MVRTVYALTAYLFSLALRAIQSRTFCSMTSSGTAP